MSDKRNEIYNDDEIDLIELFSRLWKNKLFITKSTLIFTFIGIIYSLSLKNNYTASSIFYPHYQNNGIVQGQGLKSLAGIAGINLENNSDNIPTTLYPNIISSPEFKIKILDSKIDINENKITFREYLSNKNFNDFNLNKILRLPITILSKYISKNEINSLYKKNDILEISDEEHQLHENLSNIIFLSLNEKEGFIELSVKDSNPLIASQIAKTANELLQKNIIDFKLKNLNDTYKFILTQLDIAKVNFYKLQDSLAKFSDNNLNIKSDLFLNKYSRIETEFNIAKNIYNELALNKEKTAIDVKQNTPIFTIIKPVVIPNKKSGPQRSLIVITFSFFGLLVASGHTFLKPFIFENLKKINLKK